MKKNINYIIWQNRAFNFYAASRLLYMNEQYSTAAFCANQTIETLIKATLIYWDKSFCPLRANHNFSRMLNTLKNKVQLADNKKIPDMPEYFYADNRYQTVSRYPVDGKGLLIPADFLIDLDRTFYELVCLVPFQFNSELIHAVSGKDKKSLPILKRKNKQFSDLYRFLINKEGR